MQGQGWGAQGSMGACPGSALERKLCLEVAFLWQMVAIHAVTSGISRAAAVRSSDPAVKRPLLSSQPTRKNQTTCD